MITALYIGTDKLDLFEDDNIIIKNSVAKIEDITKVFTETSNSFSVPATDNNNRIFKHYYNASINFDVFDARKLVLGAIYLDGIHYKTGNFKLNKVMVKSQKADSYSLDFFGLLTQLKELVGKDKLTDLDLSALDYSYNYSNVKNNLISNNPLKNLANTILSDVRYIYDSDSGTDNTDSLKNLANNNSSSDSGIDWIDTKSSILNIKIIEAIESKYPLTFSRDFFNNDSFSKLYLLLNGGNIKNLLKEQVVFDSITSDPTLYNDRILISTNLPLRNTHSIRITISSGDDVDYTVRVYADGVEISSFSDVRFFEERLYSSDFSNFQNLTFTVESEKHFDYYIYVDRYENNQFGPIFRSRKDNSEITGGTYSVTSKLPDITIIDYLKGIFQMFKLIVIPTSETNLFIESYENYYSNGINRDVTKFIDFSELEVSTGKLLNEINYKFEQAQTIVAAQFKTLTGVDYGNLELKITDENGKITEGEALEIELPFENMIYSKLSDVSGSNGVNVVVGTLQDENLSPVKIKPHLHYINNVSLDSDVKLIDYNNGVETSSTLNLPSHTLGYTNILYSTVYGNEFNEYNNLEIENTLFSNYHKTFIESSFNVKKRLYNYKVKNAPLDLITNLKLNDNIIIRGRAYRIDSYNTNITTKEIEFNLINIT